MCYLAHQQQAQAQPDATVPPLEGSSRLRPRWAGAAAATLVGGLAMAALVVPSWTPPSATERDPTAPPTMVTGTGPVTLVRTTLAAPVLEQTAAAVDDDVPTTGDTLKASVGGCHHGM